MRDWTLFEQRRLPVVVQCRNLVKQITKGRIFTFHSQDELRPIFRSLMHFMSKCFLYAWKTPDMAKDVKSVTSEKCASFRFIVSLLNARHDMHVQYICVYIEAWCMILCRSWTQRLRCYCTYCTRCFHFSSVGRMQCLNDTIYSCSVIQLKYV